MKAVVTGGAGFIGSSLAELLSSNYDVMVIDNLSAGNIGNLHLNDSLEFIKADCVSFDEVLSICKDSEAIFHFAANPEVRLPAGHDTTDLFTNNVIATRNMLEVARKVGVKKFVFASTSTVYGEPSIIPTPEDYGELKPISIYGATKLSCEGLVCAYCSTFNMDGIILRFANVVGPRSNHGVIFDFYNKLLQNSSYLEVLGDGKQKKSYLYIDDCIDAILLCSKSKGIEFYNIGSDDQLDVTTIAETIVESMGINTELRYTGGVAGGRGWIGDVKNMMLDTSKIRAMGFNPHFNSLQAVKQTISELISGQH